MSAPRALATAVVAMAAAALTTLLPAQSAAAAPETPALRIVITSLAPTLVTQGDTVHVTGRVTNVSKGALAQVSVRLRAVGGRLGTRDDVDTWLDGRDIRTGVPVGPPADLSGPVPAGRSASFVLDVPASSLGVRGGEFGVYPLAVDARATDVAGAREQVGFIRTTFQWQPAAREYKPQGIGWLVPFAGLPGAVTNAVPTLEQVARAVEPGQRLPRLLEAASEPGVSWAVDPQLLLTLQEAAAGELPSTTTSTASPTKPTTSGTTGGTPSGAAPTSAPATTTPGTTPPTSSEANQADRAAARDFLARMRAAAAGREVIELPYADPDLQVISDSGQMSLATAARAAGAGAVTELLGVTPRTDIAWTPDGYASDRLIGDLAGQGVTNLVLDERSRPLVDALDYTPDALTKSIPAAATAVLSDPQLSRLMTTVSSRNAAASSRFLAETAALTTERPGLARRMLVALPRNADLDPAAFRATVLAASTAPWLSPVTVGSIFEPPPDRADASQLARRAVPAPSNRATTGIEPADVDIALRLRAELSALGEVVAEPIGTTAALQRSTLDLVSSVWRGQRRALVGRQVNSAAAVHRITREVRVLKTTITFLRSSGELQLTISNGLPQKVSNLRLRVTAPSPRLVVSQEVSDPIALAPGTRTSVRVPVRALASGQVALQAQLIAPSGQEVGAPVEVQVRVRPTDSWVLLVGGAIVALVVLVGFIRALRRPRRRARLVDSLDETDGLGDLGTPTEPSKQEIGE